LKLWRENRLDQEWELTFEEIYQGFMASGWYDVPYPLERKLALYITDTKYLNSTFEKDDLHKLVDYIMKDKGKQPKPYKITPEELVHSRTRGEIQEKLQQVFGKYEDLERMDKGEISLTVEGDVSKDYMADIEHAAVERDLPETKELLRRAYDEIAEGYTKGILPAYRPSLVAELAEVWKKKQALQKGRVPNHETITELDRKYTFNELKDMCKEKGLSTSGDKKALIRRLFFGD